MAALLTIGKIARLAGVTPDTIRYYERFGVLPRSSRTPAGYRQYPDRIVNRLAVIRNAQRFGFSLKQIAGFMRVRDGGGTPCHDVRTAAQGLLDAVDLEIASLIAARRDMRRTLAAWDRTLAATPPERPARLLEKLPSGAAIRPSSKIVRRRPCG